MAMVKWHNGLGLSDDDDDDDDDDTCACVAPPASSSFSLSSSSSRCNSVLCLSVFVRFDRSDSSSSSSSSHRVCNTPNVTSYKCPQQDTVARRYNNWYTGTWYVVELHLVQLFGVSLLLNGDSPLSQRSAIANGRYCHVMYKLLYPSIRVRTAPPVSVRVRVMVSVSFSLRILFCMCGSLR